MKGQRGGESAASLSVVPIVAMRRPDPRPELSADEAETWRATVGAMKLDLFGPKAWPLLRYCCTYVALAAQLVQRLHTTAIDAPDFRRLATLHRAESKAIMLIATKLQLTPRSNRYAGGGRDGAPPLSWEE